MIIPVYRGVSTIASIETDNAKLSQKVMGDNCVNISFDNETNIAFQIGDFITVDSINYYLNILPKIEKKSTNFYSYTLVFEARFYDCAKVQYMLTGQGEFDLVGNLSVFVDLFVTNMNRVKSGWSHGTVTSTDYRNIHFSNENCLQVVQRLAKEFDVEFYFNDKQLVFTDFGSDNGITFQYGFNKGLYSITRDSIDSKNLITRLYAFGATKNLPVDYRDGDYSPRLKFVSSGNNYIEDFTYTTDIIEFTKNFDEVYPHRTGTISAVNGSDVLKFTDASIDFDLNDYWMPGVNGKVHFQDGSLGGYPIEIAAFNNSTKEFTLVLFDDGKAGKLPNSTIKPAIGNTYVLVDIIMPQSYIDTAETELLNKATDYLAQNSIPRVNYTVEIDPLFMKRYSYSLNVGDYVTINDADLGINRLIRIMELVQDLVTPERYSVVLSDIIAIGALSRMYADNLETQRIIANPLIALRDNFKVKRNWKTSEDLRAMVFDADDYFDMDNIRPLSVSTAMLSVGSKSSDFVLNGVIIEPNYTADTSKVNVSSGSLVHYSIASTITSWTITGATTTGLVSGTAYYIYAKCNRSGSDATIIFDSTQRLADSDASWYYFVVGVLHAVVDSYRGVSLTYGMTIVNGKFIKTGRITGGSSYFDLDTGDIVGKITLSSGSSGLPGGRNLYQHSDFSKSTTGLYIYPGSSIFLDANNRIVVYSDGVRRVHLIGLTLEANVMYTFQIERWYADFTEVAWRGGSVAYQALTEVARIDLPLESGVKIIYSLLLTSADSGYIQLNNNSADFRIRYPKLEKGYSYTDWTEAPEDVTAYADAVTQTTIDGGIVTSGTIQVANTATVIAGMTGAGIVDLAAESPVRFWAGDTFDNREVAPFQILENGDMRMYYPSVSGGAGTYDYILITDGRISFKTYDGGNMMSIWGSKDVNQIDSVGISIGQTHSWKLIKDATYGAQFGFGFGTGSNFFSFLKFVNDVYVWEVERSVAFDSIYAKNSTLPIKDSSGNTILTISSTKATLTKPLVLPVYAGTLPSSPSEGEIILQSYSGIRIRAYVDGAWESWTKD